MFYKLGLFTPLQRASQISPFSRLRAFHESSLKGHSAQKLRSLPSSPRTIPTHASATFPRPGLPRAVSPKGLIVVGCVGLGLTLSLNRPSIHCDAYRGATAEATPKRAQSAVDSPSSEVNYYELSFGTVAGVCAGIFVKKGAKLAATLLGGVFVLLQYFHSMSFIRVDWSKIGEGFKNVVYIEDEDNVRHPPTILSLSNWLIEFLTADFQPRATFIAGFLLGLRIG